MSTSVCKNCNASPCQCGCKFHGPDDEVPIGGKPSEALVGQLRDPDGETVSTGKWGMELAYQQEAELVVEVPAGVAFAITGTDVERLARKLVNEGTAMSLIEEVLGLYGLSMERDEDANFQVNLRSKIGSVFFDHWWQLDHGTGTITEHKAEAGEFPGWVVAHLEATKPKMLPVCYICGQDIEPGNLVTLHRNPVDGRDYPKHNWDCTQ